MKILLSGLAALLLIGCGGEKTDATTAEKAPQTAAEPVQTPAAPAPQKSEPAPVPEPAPVVAVDGAMLFKQKCASCHGQNAEKSALNTSQVIAGWSAEKVTDAITGYQSGMYGGSMKGMMQGQVRALDKAQIEALAHYISTL